MLNKILIILGILALLLFTGCAPKEEKPSEIPKIPEQIVETPPAIEEIDEVGTGISDITTVDEELDSSGLDDLDTILEDIENI